MIRILIFKMLYGIGLLNLIRRLNIKSGRFPILVFHRVSPYADPLWPPLTPQVFEETLVLLKKHYLIFSLDDLFLLDKDQLKKACFITFDDGFEDTFIWARPILLKHKIPATFFIPTAAIESQEIIWPLKLRNSVYFTNKGRVVFAEINGNPFLFNSLEERITSYQRFLKHLSTLKEEDFTIMFNRIIEVLGHYEDQHIAVVSKHQLEELSMEFSIQSHTHSHLYISKLSLERIDQELDDSIQKLNSFTTQKSITQLAYPIGDHTTEAETIAARYFSAAFCVGEESVRKDNLSVPEYRMRIPRYNIHHQSSYEILAYINGFHRFVRTFHFN